jgi:predicted enzyme related to lactoylglutathione lyase
MITSIAFTAYPVSDMARARAFYEQALGLAPGELYSDRWTEYDLGDTAFAITTVDMGHPPGTKGALVAFEVDDLDATMADLKAKSVPIVRDVFDTPVCRMAVIEDPDGNHVTIHKRKGE